MQWQYYRSHSRRKREIINELHPSRCREIGAWIVVTVYMILSAVSLSYPMVWYFYVWIYLNVVEDTDIIISGGDTVTAKNVFYWIIVGCYCLLLSIWMLFGIAYLLERGSGEGMAKLKALLFVWSVGHYVNEITVSGAEELYRQLPTVGTVLEMNFVDYNLALLVLSYLYTDSRPIK